MKNKNIKFIIITLVLISLLFVNVSAAESFETFSYSYDGNLQIMPDAYNTNFVVSEIKDAGSLKEPQDILYDDKSGYLFIADSGNNRIVIADTDFKLVNEISEFNNGGKKDTFLNPMGVFVDDKGYLFVADTNNGRIIIFNEKYEFFKELPTLSADILPENFKYNPKAIAVDRSGRIYVISRNSNMGVVALDSNGNFEAFIGAQKVSVNAAELIWRAFMTEEQLARTTSYVPVEYSNITIDSKGFLYVTCAQIERYDLYSYIWSRSTSSSFAPIKKINPSGTDVLKRNGFFPPAGNILFDAYSGKESGKPSNIVEVELLENGVYALVDSEYSKMFFYDSNGNLLYAFGGEGNFSGLYNNLCSITHNGQLLYALDSASGAITVLEKTEYGLLIDEVLELQENRKYDEAAKLWEKMLSQNNNFDMAYLGMGKNLLENENYTKAMSYFKLIGNKTYYGQAFKLYREEILGQYGFIFFLIFVVIIAALAFLLKKIKQYNLKVIEKPSSGKIKDQLLYLFYILRHPIQGFWGLKAEKRGSIKSASIILFITAISSIVSTLGGSYLKDSKGSILSAFTIIFALFLFMICNMCFTSLMDGKGTLKDVYITISYASAPYALFMIPSTVLSYVLTTDELSILKLATTVVICWMVALIIIGSMTVHDYSFSKNLLVCGLTVVGILFLLFIVLLFINLSGQVISAVSNIITEINYRM